MNLNEAALKQYGWNRDELLGKPIKTLVPKERHAQADELLKQCKDGGAVKNVEGIRCSKKGKQIPVLLTFSLLTDEQGNPQ